MGIVFNCCPVGIRGSDHCQDSRRTSGCSAPQSWGSWLSGWESGQKSLNCAIHWRKSTLWKWISLKNVFRSQELPCCSVLILNIVSYTALSPLECHEVKSVVMFSVQLCLLTTWIFIFLSGIGTLIANNVYDAAYPLHDVRMHFYKSISLLVSLRRHPFIDIIICCLWHWKSLLSVVLVWKLLYKYISIVT